MSAVRSWWGEVGEAVLDLAVPQQCAGCAAPGRAWCRACAQACAGQSVRVPLGVPCRAACEHSGPAGRAVVSFKDDQVRRLAGPLAHLLASAVGDALADAQAPSGVPVWLVPIPSRRSAVRARGADHVAVLAGRASRLLRRSGVPAFRCQALAHVRDSRDQVGLTRQQRQRNVDRTLRALDLPEGVIVVVDDVTTTGATLAEGLRAFRRAGRRVECAAVVTWAAPARHRASDSDRD